MLEALGSAFGRGGIEVMGEAAGLHLALRFGGEAFRGLRFDGPTVSRIASAGAAAYPASRFAHAPYPGVERILLMGFGGLDPRDIRRGVEALAEALAPR